MPGEFGRRPAYFHPVPDAFPDIPQALAARLATLESQHRQTEALLADPEVMGDHRKVRELSIKKAASEPVVEAYRELERLRAEHAELTSALGDPELAELAAQELPGVAERAEGLIETIKNRLVTAADRAVGAVILEIRAGTGGDEAGLWAADLLGVYQKYAQRRGWEVEVFELSADAGLGGVRHAVVGVRGEGVWSELAFEAGVHSVKRVPATETQGRIHTSTATVAVLPEPEEVEVRIDWAKDVTEHVTTSQGPGGQNVNKVATAVHLVHEPTGIEVRMQESKSQHQNREKARRLLMARVYEHEREAKAAERSAERRSQIGGGGRSEKIRVYRYQDGIVADQRLDTKFNLRDILEGDLGPLFEALIEREVARRLEAL